MIVDLALQVLKVRQKLEFASSNREDTAPLVADDAIVLLSM